MFSPCKITFNTYDWIKRIDFTPYIYIFVGWHVILEDLSSLAQHCSKFLLCIRMPHNLIRWLNSNAIASMIVHVGFPDPQIPSFDPQVTLSIKAKIYLWIVAHHLETFSIAISPRIRLNRRKENIPLRASRHDLNLISKFKKGTIFALINYISFQLHLNQWLSFLFQNLPIFFQLSYRPYAYSIEDYRLDSCSQSSKRVQTFLRPRWLSFDLRNQALSFSFRVSYQLRLEIRISLP